MRVFLKTDIYTVPTYAFWDRLEDFIVTIASLTSQLTVLHIALQDIDPSSFCEYEQVLYTSNFLTHKPPPATIAGFFLTRYGYGHQIGYWGTTQRAEPAFVHDVAGFGAYTFTKGDQSGVLWIPFKQDGRKLKAYPPEGLSSLPVDSRDTAARRPFEIQEWTEVPGPSACAYVKHDMAAPA
jgi:hypothetical protein